MCHARDAAINIDQAPEMTAEKQDKTITAPAGAFIG